tara:strand:+ start:588 stop:725 length:138 start_codon:yes stop_codon:yes gene_type:complete
MQNYLFRVGVIPKASIDVFVSLIIADAIFDTERLYAFIMSSWSGG